MARKKVFHDKVQGGIFIMMVLLVILYSAIMVGSHTKNVLGSANNEAGLMVTADAVDIKISPACTFGYTVVNDGGYNNGPLVALDDAGNVYTSVYIEYGSNDYIKKYAGTEEIASVEFGYPVNDIIVSKESDGEKIIAVGSKYNPATQEYDSVIKKYYDALNLQWEKPVPGIQLYKIVKLTKPDASTVYYVLGMSGWGVNRKYTILMRDSNGNPTGEHQIGSENIGNDDMAVTSDGKIFLINYIWEPGGIWGLYSILVRIYGPGPAIRKVIRSSDIGESGKHLFAYRAVAVGSDVYVLGQVSTTDWASTQTLLLKLNSNGDIATRTSWGDGLSCMSPQMTADDSGNVYTAEACKQGGSDIYDVYTHIFSQNLAQSGLYKFLGGISSSDTAMDVAASSNGKYFAVGVKDSYTHPKKDMVVKYSCAAAVCGDNVVMGDEECDGNRMAFDEHGRLLVGNSFCSHDCKLIRDTGVEVKDVEWIVKTGATGVGVMEFNDENVVVPGLVGGFMITADVKDIGKPLNWPVSPEATTDWRNAPENTYVLSATCTLSNGGESLMAYAEYTLPAKSPADSSIRRDSDDAFIYENQKITVPFTIPEYAPAGRYILEECEFALKDTSPMRGTGFPVDSSCPPGAPTACATGISASYGLYDMPFGKLTADDIRNMNLPTVNNLFGCSTRYESPSTDGVFNFAGSCSADSNYFDNILTLGTTGYCSIYEPGCGKQQMKYTATNVKDIPMVRAENRPAGIAWKDPLATKTPDEACKDAYGEDSFALYSESTPTVDLPDAVSCAFGDTNYKEAVYDVENKKSFIYENNGKKFRVNVAIYAPLSDGANKYKGHVFVIVSRVMPPSTALADIPTAYRNEFTTEGDERSPVQEPVAGLPDIRVSIKEDGRMQVSWLGWDKKSHVVNFGSSAFAAAGFPG